MHKMLPHAPGLVEIATLVLAIQFQPYSLCLDRIPGTVKMKLKAVVAKVIIERSSGGIVIKAMRRNIPVIVQ